MSRGPGRWQRAVLAALEGGEPVILTHSDHTPAEQAAIRRAAYRLEADDRVRLTSLRIAGRPRLVAFPTEGEMPEPLEVTGLDGKVYRMPNDGLREYAALLDRLTPDEFESVLVRARADGDLSREGVVRSAGALGL